jgi:mannose-6-phosphate isomerase-like protein (cupin superfamily)
LIKEIEQIDYPGNKMLKHVPKIWGAEDHHCNNELYCLKRLYVAPGYRCSVHRHIVKDESFVVESGQGFIELEDKRIMAFPGITVRIPPGTWHRFGSEKGMVLLEVSTHHENDDVERRDESGRL